MSYALRAGLHFCDAGGQLIFLDVDADRYFGLPEDLERAFRRLLDPAPSDSAAADDVAALLARGLIAGTPGLARFRPCPAVSIPQISALDEPAGRIGWSRRVGALAHLLTVTWTLRVRGFAAMLGSLERRKCRVRPVGAPLDLAAEAAAFASTGRWLRTHDKCLSRSLAITRRLRHLGCPAKLVVGVRLRPFAAHCWAQTDARLINDRFEHVRTYHPILLI